MLYHFSEGPDIRTFVPHRAANRTRDEPTLVWAIDAWHAPMYYVPRQCPRACFWPGPQTTDADRQRWCGGVQARRVIAVESAWLGRIRAATLYRYAMPPESFILNDAIAGQWVSREPVTPLAVTPMGDLLEALTAVEVELRITPSLIALWERVIRSTLGFSGTRLRNAHGYESLRVPEGQPLPPAPSRARGGGEGRGSAHAS